VLTSGAVAVLLVHVLAAEPAAEGADEVSAESVLEAEEADVGPRELTPIVKTSDEAPAEPGLAASAEQALHVLPAYPSPARGVGVRAGYADFRSDKGRINGAPLIGLFLDRRRGDRVACEIGLDFSRPEAADGSFVSSLLLGRVDVLLSAGGAGPVAGGYFLCGVGGAAESTSGLTGSYNNFVGAIDLGAGFGIADGRFDLRFTHAVPLGSENASAITLVTLGMRF